MRKLERAAAVVASALLLLAAGKAPAGSDFDFTSGASIAEAFQSVLPTANLEEADFEASLVSDNQSEASEATIAMVDEVGMPELIEPDLGPVIPESTTLAAMVSGVKALPFDLDQQMNCLATTIYFESKGEPLEGQLAVAQVVLNRVENGRFGKDVCSVVTAPKQFSFVVRGELPPPSDKKAWETARAVAMIAATDSWTDVVSNATHFHATRVSPNWRGLKRVALIGNHVFYR